MDSAESAARESRTKEIVGKIKLVSRVMKQSKEAEMFDFKAKELGPLAASIWALEEFGERC